MCKRLEPGKIKRRQHLTYAHYLTVAAFLSQVEFVSKSQIEHVAEETVNHTSGPFDLKMV